MTAKTRAPEKPTGLVATIVKAAAWCRSAEGRKDIGALVAAVTAIYTAIHRAGI